MRKEFTEDVILAGLNAEHFDSVANQWYPIPNCTDIGALGEDAEKKEKTNLGDDVKRYGSGMQDAPDKAIKGQVIPFQDADSPYYQAYLDQQRFIKRARNREEFMVRVTWKDGETNSFLFKALGYQVDSPNQAEWKMFTVNGVQNTRVLWDVEVTGATTLAAAADTTLTAATVPSDLKLNTGETFKWSSSDVAVATVDAATGEVTGVAAGTVTIMAEIRGVTGYHEITVTA